MHSSLQEKRVLVTGAGGFIGGWLCKRLVEEKAEVIGLVHRGTEGLAVHGISESVEAVKCDINNAAELSRVFSGKKPALCFHLAAVSSTRDAANDLAATFQTNVIATLNVLEAAKQAGTAVCFASTVKVYGGRTENGFKEDAPQLGSNAYATSKICGEEVCRMYAEERGMDIAIARPSNVFGWGDMRFERLVPGAIKAVLSGEKPRVKGKGESSFDWVFVGDVADALAAIGERMLQRRMVAEPFNIGTGQAASVREVVEKIIRLSGSKAEMEFFGEEKPAKEILLIGKAKRELQWQPKYTLGKALQETIDWYKKYLK